MSGWDSEATFMTAATALMERWGAEAVVISAPPPDEWGKVRLTAKDSDGRSLATMGSPHLPPEQTEQIRNTLAGLRIDMGVDS